jgi:hypothetical protein
MAVQMLKDCFAHGGIFPVTTFSPNNSIVFAVCAAYRVIAATNTMMHGSFPTAVLARRNVHAGDGMSSFQKTNVSSPIDWPID